MKSLKFFGKLRKLRLPLGLYRVVGMSMAPTLRPRIIVLAKRTRTIREGDIVVFRHDQLDKIKRVAGLAKDGYFMLGDNLSASTDSRHFGTIPASAIQGRIVWPRTSKK